MGNWLDMISSFLIGGMVLLQLIAYQFFLSSGLCENTVSVMTQGAFVASTGALERDLVQCGYQIKGANRFQTLDDEELVFLVGRDDNGDGYCEASTPVRYHLAAPPAGMWDGTGTVCLMRTSGSDPPQVLLTGITAFAFSYFNRTNEPSAASADVRLVRIEATIVGPIEAADSPPLALTYVKTIKPLNLF